MAVDEHRSGDGAVVPVVVPGEPASGAALRVLAAQVMAMADLVERREQEIAAGAAAAAAEAPDPELQDEVMGYLMVFYRACLFRLQEHVWRGGTAVGVGKILKDAALEVGMPVEEITLPRHSRASAQLAGNSKRNRRWRDGASS